MLWTRLIKVNQHIKESFSLCAAVKTAIKKRELPLHLGASCNVTVQLSNLTHKNSNLICGESAATEKSPSLLLYDSEKNNSHQQEEETMSNVTTGG